MTIQARIPKINQVAQNNATREVYRRNACHRAYAVSSTRTGDGHQVVIDISRPGILTIRAELVGLNFTGEAHPGNFGKTVNYLVLGAIKKAVKDNGKVISFCETSEAARRISRFGGELVKVHAPGGGIVWGTIR